MGLSWKYIVPHLPFLLLQCSHTGLLSVDVFGDTGRSWVSKGVSEEMSGKYQGQTLWGLVGGL